MHYIAMTYYTNKTIIKVTLKRNRRKREIHSIFTAVFLTFVNSFSAFSTNVSKLLAITELVCYTLRVFCIFIIYYYKKRGRQRHNAVFTYPSYL